MGRRAAVFSFSSSSSSSSSSEEFLAGVRVIPVVDMGTGKGQQGEFVR